LGTDLNYFIDDETREKAHKQWQATADHVAGMLCLTNPQSLLELLQNIQQFIIPWSTEVVADAKKAIKHKNINNKGKNKEMKYYVPKGCSFFQRNNDGRWVGRIRIRGKQVDVACRHDKRYVYDELMKAHRAKEKNPIQQEKGFRLFEWLDHWHKVFRLPKRGIELSESSIKSDIYYINKIKKIFKNERLEDLTADVIQQTLYSMTQGRTCEGVYGILKLALSKARDRTGGTSVMELVEKVRHERVKGRALNNGEIKKILEATRNETERDIIKFYLYTGCRVDEISATKVEFINLTEEERIITGLQHKNRPIPDMRLLPNEVLIYGSKTRLSIRAMPILPPLRPILERITANRDGNERLFKNHTTVMIRNFHELIKDATKITFTLKDYRHTAATSFKDAGIPSGVYFRWFGWSDDTMARKVYTHETEYEKKVSQEWAQKFNNS